MAVYLGTQLLQRCYIGPHRVDEVYRGARRVWRQPTSGRWRFEFPGRAGVYNAADYAADVDRLDCELTTFPVSVASGYPGLYLATANPLQYSSNTVLHVRSPLLFPDPATELLVEFELAMGGTDNGALRFSLFDDAVGMVFDKTGLEAGMTPRLWAGQKSARVGLHDSRVDGQIGRFGRGRAVLWLHDGVVDAVVGAKRRARVDVDPGLTPADAVLDIRVQAKAAFVTAPIPVPPYVVPVPIFPPIMHALVTFLGADARARAAELSLS